MQQHCITENSINTTHNYGWCWMDGSLYKTVGLNKLSLNGHWWWPCSSNPVAVYGRCDYPWIIRYLGLSIQRLCVTSHYYKVLFVRLRIIKILALLITSFSITQFQKLIPVWKYEYKIAPVSCYYPYILETILLNVCSK